MHDEPSNRQNLLNSADFWLWQSVNFLLGPDVNSPLSLVNLPDRYLACSDVRFSEINLALP